jgi:hypothetical protein
MYPDPKLYGPFSLQFAHTDADRASAYRLRYEVFSQELGRVFYANHKDRTYKDRVDDGSAHILVVKNEREFTGTLRFTLRTEAAFLSEDEGYFSEIISEFGEGAVALADRGAIAASSRGHQLYPQMWDYGFQFVQSRGARVVVGVIDADNDFLSRFHARQGWDVLVERITDGETDWTYLLKRLD